MAERGPRADPRLVPNGSVSFWREQLGRKPLRPALPGDIDVDVCIVGAGYTGLWAAYYLKTLDPSLRLAIVEARFAGFGASGRNGGWLTNSVTGGREQYVAEYGVDGAQRQQDALTGAVAEVVRVAAAEAIDADIVQGGELTVAYTPAQLARRDALVRAEARWSGTDVVALDRAETAARVRTAGALGAAWHPHSARVHPAKLADGLAATVERLGVPIYEGTQVSRIEPGRAVTTFGDVRAQVVLRATEGFTADLAGEHRTWLPLNSSLIVSRPLEPEAWERIRWSEADVLGDFAHVYTYAQRTADGRIALGGRGVPYRFGSRIDADGATHRRTVAALADALHGYFPAARSAGVAHAWSGVLGVPRDWAATVGLDERSGLGWAGGYVGTGVAASNLAGRTLADLVLRRQTYVVDLPWVGRRARRWEAEPLRWLAVRSIYAAYGVADRQEARMRTPRTSSIARAADMIAGR